MTDWRKWLQGLIATVVNGVASGVVLMLTGLANDPASGQIQWEKLGSACVILGVFGAANYLKQHPTPEWDGLDRRVTTPTTGGGQ